jgi:hypothetical protein
MTEAEWLNTTDPTPMIGFVRDKTSERKLRLLTVAACYRVWSSFDDERSRRGIEAAENYADGKIDEVQLDDALWAAYEVSEAVTYSDSGETTYRLRYLLAEAARKVAQPPKSHIPETGRVVPYDGWEALVSISEAVGVLHPDTVVQRVPYPEGDLILPAGIELTDPVSLDEQTAQCALLRDIFGNPFRPVSFNPAWRTDTAVSLARGMYDSREFGAMPILADALQDAGCEDEQIQMHCRDANQPHVRGCWVCDFVLGKE